MHQVQGFVKHIYLAERGCEEHIYPWTPKSVKSGVTCFAIIGHEETYSEGQ